MATLFALPSLPLTSITPLAPHAVVVAVLLSLNAAGAQAQSAGLPLRSSPLLEEKVSAREKSEGAVFVQGQTITARPDMDLAFP